MEDIQQPIRQQLLDYLKGKHAHADLNDALENFPLELINQKPENSPHTFWQVIEHIRLTQNDIVEFIVNPDYAERKWPEEYWPKPEQTADTSIWNWGVAEFKKDYERLQNIVSDPKMDLLVKIPHGQGQTIFREVILVIDHNSYHIGQFILMRKMMGNWNK